MNRLVLKTGHVELYSHDASDLKVVNAARVSFGKRHPSLQPADIPLIDYLMREQHMSPFEHSTFTFVIKCPIFVAREWMRHRTGSFNEVSARYTELEDDFYIPAPENIRKREGKPGDYHFVPVADKDTEQTVIRELGDAYGEAWDAYKKILDLGVAPEVARMCLPVGINTEFFWTVNARNLMHFLDLRLGVHALYEIQEYAKAVRDIFGSVMPSTFIAWERYGAH